MRQACLATQLILAASRLDSAPPTTGEIETIFAACISICLKGHPPPTHTHSSSPYPLRQNVIVEVKGQERLSLQPKYVEINDNVCERVFINASPEYLSVLMC